MPNMHDLGHPRPKPEGDPPSKSETTETRPVADDTPSLVRKDMNKLSNIIGLIESIDDRNLPSSATDTDKRLALVDALGIIRRWRDEMRRSLPDLEQRSALSYEAEKHAWIAAYGSDDLKRLASEGYDANERYMQERITTELPGFRKLNSTPLRVEDHPEPSPQMLDDIHLARERGIDATAVTCQLRLRGPKEHAVLVKPGRFASANKYFIKVYGPTR